MYISVPLVLYVGERTLRAFRSKAYAVKILKVTESSKSSSNISLSWSLDVKHQSAHSLTKTITLSSSVGRKDKQSMICTRGMCRFGLVVSCLLQIVATTMVHCPLENGRFQSHMKGSGMWTVRWGYGARSLWQLGYVMRSCRLNWTFVSFRTTAHH